MRDVETLGSPLVHESRLTRHFAGVEWRIGTPSPRAPSPGPLRFALKAAS